MRRWLSSETLKADAIAGITVALVLIPQSLAYAQLAGLPVNYGLYAALIPPFVAALFGSSKQLATGPVAVLSLMTAAALEPYATAGTSEYVALAIILALCLGVFQLLLGTLKLGGLISFLSHPVIYGFTNASAIIIATTQLSKFFGVSVPAYEHHYQTVVAVLQKGLAQLDVVTFIFGLLALAAMYVLRRINRKLPAVLIVVFISTTISWLSGYSGSLVGYIPEGLPRFQAPVLDLNVLPSLFLTIVTMSLIAFTEAISIAQAIAVKTGDKIDPNKELIGQGLANAMGSFFQSYGVAGSFSRTAVNYQAGAKSGMSSLISSVIVLLTLLFFTPLLYYLPQVVLAAVIVLSVRALIDVSKLKHIWTNNQFDAVSAVLTFIATLYFAPHLDKGVAIGVAFSIGYYVYRNAHPRIVFLSKYKDGSLHDSERFRLDRCKNIAVIRLDAPLFFANVAYFEKEIIDYLAENAHVHHILITGSGINEIDSTGEEMLETMMRAFRESKKRIYFSDIKLQVMEVLERSGFVQELGKKQFFPTSAEAIDHIIKQVEHAKEHLDKSSCPLQKYVKAPVAVKDVVKDKRETVAYFYHRLLALRG